MNFKYAAVAALSILACAVRAEVSLGPLRVLSGYGAPLKAEIELRHPQAQSVSGLQATVKPKTNKQAWEEPANLSFRIDDRAGSAFLLISSQENVTENPLNITVGIKADNEGARFQTYSYSFDAGEPVASDTSLVLRLSTDLHYVVAFAPGSVNVSKSQRDTLAQLAADVPRSERVQLKGWAGPQKSGEKRMNMAFARAYAVRSALEKTMGKTPKLRIIKPDIALRLLADDQSNQPRVVATLLANTDPAKVAELDDMESSPDKIPMRPVYRRTLRAALD